MKNWLKFNESEFKSTKEYDREELINHVYTIRDSFIDFEDLGIVESYSFGYSRSDTANNILYEPKAGYSFMPNGRLGIDEVVEEWVTFFNLNTGTERLERRPFIKVNIKFPSENAGIINSKGIKLFENILEVNSRLVDMEYDIKLDMNGGHTDYKPMSFKIYFKFKGNPI